MLQPINNISIIRISGILVDTAHGYMNSIVHTPLYNLNTWYALKACAYLRTYIYVTYPLMMILTPNIEQRIPYVSTVAKKKKKK